MSIIEIIILAIGLSMDAFAVSICKGLSLGKIKPKHMAIAGIWFGGFQALMPVIGYFLGNVCAEFVSRFQHWIAFILLVCIGVGMIKEACSEAEKVDDNMDPFPMFLLAVATSIDALAVGVTFSFLKVNIIVSALLIGCITFAFSAAGVKIGSVFGMKYRAKAEVVGGIILIGIGVKILVKALMV